MREPPPDSTTSSALDEPTTTGAEQSHIRIATNMGETTVDPFQHATRDPRFAPRARKAFFSTELGTQSPRPLDLAFVPAVARSCIDPVAVVQAARYWQIKYTSELRALMETCESTADYCEDQCLCIFPNQGWVVEDLWDAADIHVEGREFCQEMLNFISRDTYYAADRFAKDWAQEHFELVDFTGINIGDVYDLDDKLAALDRIFIFGELISFPRVFLWHVAFMLISNWSTANLANAPALNACQDQYRSVMTPQSTGEAMGSSVKASASEVKKTVSSPDDADRTDSIAFVTTDQSKLQIPPQHSTPHSSQLPSDHPVHSRYTGAERMTGLSTASSSMRAQALKAQKGNRNPGPPQYNQPQGWIENESRTVSGPCPGQQPGPMSGIQLPQYATPPIAVSPHMNTQMIPGSAMSPYAMGPPVSPHPGYPVQPMEPAMVPRGHINYQSGINRGLHMPPAYVNQPKGSQPILMGDTTNMHLPGFIGSQVVDPRAPMPRRLNHQSTGQLFDPYNGNSRKFSGGQVYNDMGKKGGPSNFVAPQTRGRKMSTSSGRLAYSSQNHMVPTSSRFTETSNRRRQVEVDTSVASDSVSGCGDTWIGPHNTTVNELWIGELPHNISEGELIQLFEQTVGITPIAISLRSTASTGHVHAFATFASSAAARTALTINQFDPKLRNGEVRPAISVPRRFYQKESPPIACSDYSRIIHAPSSHIRGVSNAPHGGKSTATNTDNKTATTRDTVVYSPQDARSGLPKKPPTVELEATNLAEPKTSELEKSKRQSKSPPKKPKGKNKRDLPIKKDLYVDDVPNPNEKPEVDILPPVTIEDRPSSRAAHKDVEDTHSTEVHVESTSNVVQDVCHVAKERQDSIEQPPEQSVQSDSLQNKDNVTRSKSPSTHTEASFETKSFQTPQHDDTTMSAPETSRKTEDDVSDDGAKNDNSFHSVPEEQPEAMQKELELDFQDQGTYVNHGTATPTSEVIHGSPLQDSAKPLIPAEKPTPDTAREFHSNPEQPTPVSSNTEGNQEDCESGENSGQDKAIGAETSYTRVNPVKQGKAMSTTNKGASTDIIKKCGAQQVQSLHPFATKNKAQAKKEKETRKKQQRKEEADRIAKCKADKADKIASSKKAKSGTDPQPKTETSTNPGPPSVTPSIHSDSEAASPNVEKDALEGIKKSESQSKVTIDSANEEYKQKSGSEKEKIDERSVGTSRVTTSVPQKVDKFEAVKTPAVTQDLSVRVEAQLGSVLSTVSSPAVPTPSTSHSDHAQPNPITHDPSLSRRSSISTIAGDGPCELTDTSFAPPNTIEASGPPRDISAGATVTQPDNASAETPKKKKNKRKNKKKKTPVAETSTVDKPGLGGNTSWPFPESAIKDTHNYDPYTSHMSHIDAIRYNIKHDNTSYFARTNARMEQERKKREANEREA